MLYYASLVANPDPSVLVKFVCVYQTPTNLTSTEGLQLNESTGRSQRRRHILLDACNERKRWSGKSCLAEVAKHFADIMFHVTTSPQFSRARSLGKWHQAASNGSWCSVFRLIRTHSMPVWLPKRRPLQSRLVGDRIKERPLSTNG